MYFYVLWLLVGFLLTLYDSNYRTNEFFCLNNVCQLSLVNYYFGITNGTNLLWGLSNTENFSLPMAQTFCGVVQILKISVYRWHKPFVGLFKYWKFQFTDGTNLLRIPSAGFVKYSLQIMNGLKLLHIPSAGFVKYYFQITNGPNLIQRQLLDTFPVGHWTKE
jgi:hypothetical protein